MPDHYHLLVKIMANNVFSKYIGTVENSYTRYFNILNRRKGPLWQSRFRSIQIYSEEQLLHVSRYIHLNPVTDFLVDKPEQWEYSSYSKFIQNHSLLQSVLTEITIHKAKYYKKFVESRIDYQRKLKKIRKMLLE